MSIHIKELIIRAICGDQKDQQANKPSSDQSKAGLADKLSYSQRKQIIDDCAVEVLHRLKSMNEI